MLVDLHLRSSIKLCCADVGYLVKAYHLLDLFLPELLMQLPEPLSVSFVLQFYLLLLDPLVSQLLLSFLVQLLFDVLDALI